MSTPIAPFAFEEPDYYDKNFRAVTFYFPRGYKYPELEQEVLSLRHEHRENEAADKAAHIEKLETQLDDLIDKKRLATAKLSLAENAHLEAVRQHANAESTLTNRTTERTQIKWSIQERVGLRKRSEKADDEARITKAQTWVDKAAMADSEAVTALRYAIRDVEEARAALVVATRAALVTKGELDRLNGIKNDYSESGLSMG